ncbi:universal stress protein [Kaistia geumhonensis]|uniref:Nucleotide-binding universal stress UspA family protein n=1 Tax=Kaistia geumhonensis TaxID=410839 RepID=A0ABU0MAQ5_9HYPH|nr:universal stress protein [Kaistia geumhonensis]MCX5480977.1 universal stress protein [Kaistia geumhonensis]MDQ0518034.1 nucleotide-binding universal stress UspA family protein [Kaistia geumhonensis]
MTGPRYRIAHTTDFSLASRPAFVHALALAVALKAEFQVLHVQGRGDEAGHFPAVRETLAGWGLIAADAPRETVDRDSGVLVSKVDIRDHDPASGVERFLSAHAADLLVLGSHAREGLDRVLHGSISERIAAETEVPVLFVPLDRPGFADPATGALSLQHILMPIADQPPAGHALNVVARLSSALGLADDAVELLHVGERAPRIPTPSGEGWAPVRLASGPLIETILAHAGSADLVAMPTRRHDSLLDMLRGTHTERVMRQAPCPVLAIPA